MEYHPRSSELFRFYFDPWGVLNEAEDMVNIEEEEAKIRGDAFPNPQPFLVDEHPFPIECNLEEDLMDINEPILERVPKIPPSNPNIPEPPLQDFNIVISDDLDLELQKI